MDTTIQTEQQQESEEMLSLRDILDIFVFNWKWFIASIIVCTALGYLYLSSKSNIYQRQAVMLVKDDNGSYGSRRGGTDALMQLNGVMMGTSVENEVYILQSHLLMKEVARNLNLDINYSYKHHLKTIRLYDVKPFTAEFDSVETSLPFSFMVEILGDKARIFDMHHAAAGKEEIDFDETVAFGQPVELPYCGKVTLLADSAYIRQFIGEEIKLTRMTIEGAAYSYGGALSAEPMSKMGSLVRISYADSNIHRAEDIINAVLDAYKNSIIRDKNILAESTANFINERIDLISKDLNQVESQMAQFKQSNKLVDVQGDANIFLQQSNQALQRSIQLESQIGVVQYLLEELRNKAKGNDLIPTLGGLTDAGIQQQIVKYNELMLERNRLSDNTSESSPKFAQVTQNLYHMRQTIIASTEAYLSSLRVQLRRAQQEENRVNSRISAVPAKEKQAMDIQRQQAIKETLYTYLLNKREETALQLAITEANIRIVELPFGSNAPISPKRNMILLVAFVIGIALPFAFFYIRNLLNMSVRGRKDIETYTKIPVVGEIPHRKEGISDAEILVGEQKTDTINEAFRMLRFSLGFIKKDARVIMFTSTIPGEGKTFISRNFAVTLGMTGKKVVLVDTDIRKRTQSKLSGMTRREGLTSYLSGATDDVRSLVVSESPEYNVDVLPAGVTPPNPSELLMSERLEQLIEELKKYYDYVVIDNVPAQVVADAGIVNRVAEVTLYVIREGKIDRRYLPELQRLYAEHKFNNLCIILNDSKMEQKRYGYGYGRYGYGYGYGYSYGYGYGYSDSEADKKRNKK